MSLIACNRGKYVFYNNPPEYIQPLKWEIVHGVFTPGGDPLLICPVCKSKESEHLGGIEFPQHWNYCPICGIRLEE